MMQIVRLKQTTSSELKLTWDDGHEGPVSLTSLRDACPCAGCQGETVLFRQYTAPAPDTGVPGRYTLKGASPVGGYALQFAWGDGHDQGLYTWEHLRALCECPECKENHVRR